MRKSIRVALGLIAFILSLGGNAQMWGQVVGPAMVGGVQYHPITEADAADALAHAVTATASLEQRLNTAGDSAAGWKAYLGWDKYQEQIRKPKPDTKLLSNVYGKLAAGHEGLEQKWFAELRGSLGQYLAVVGGVGNADLEAAVQAKLEALDKQIKSLSSPPKSEETGKISDSLLWLETARQAPQLVQETRARFSSPNFQVRISGAVLGLGTGGPVDEVAPIDDVIIGTTIHGSGRTIAHTHVSLTENSNFAMFDVVMRGVNYSNTIGHNGPVCIYATGTTQITACKRFWFDVDGMHALTAAANAEAHTKINNIQSIKGRRIVERIAWRKAGQQLGQAEAVASQHARGKVGPRVDAQAEPQIRDANEKFATKTKKPLVEWRLFPRLLSFATTTAGIEIRGVEGLNSQLAASLPPPELTRPAEITVRVHESTINNGAENILTGMRLTDDMVRRTAKELLGQLPDQLLSDKDKEPFTVVFPKEQLPRVPPITVLFAEGRISITLRGREFYTGEKRQPGMYITATYKFEQSPQGYKAIRQGDLQIYGFGQRPGAPRSFRQEAIWKALQRKFGKLFGPEIALKGIKLGGKFESAGQFVPTEIISQNGWMAVGYNRSGGSTVVAAMQ